MMLLPLLALLGFVGLSQTARLPFIIGGTESEVGQWPWQGSLQINNNHNCGCALISTNWAVTAAHCVGGSSYSVVFGLHDRFDFGIGSPKRYYASGIYRHRDFVNGGVFPNDIALIWFSANVQTNKYVQIVTMAPSGADYDGMKCWITGWGVTTTGGGSLARRLRQAEIFIINQATCRNYWRVGSGHICVGEKNSKGSCNGDSGGPLVCYKNGRYELAGVTSFGIIGCYTSHPSVYTRISYYRNWIKGISGL